MQKLDLIEYNYQGNMRYAIVPYENKNQILYDEDIAKISEVSLEDYNKLTLKMKRELDDLGRNTFVNHSDASDLVDFINGTVSKENLSSSRLNFEEIFCDHCEDKIATVYCPECHSKWCKNCVSPKECLTCGCKLEF